MTGVALEIRRGPGKWLVVPLALIGIFAVRQSVPAGTAVWPLIVSALANGTDLMGPVAGGAAALAGTRSHRRNTEVLERQAARSPAAAGLAELGALLLWTLGAFVLLVAGVYLPAMTTATWSGPDVLPTLAAGGGLLLQVAIGYVLGRVLPSRLTPLFVALLLYGVVAYNNVSRTGFGWSLFGTQAWA